MTGRYRERGGEGIQGDLKKQLKFAEEIAHISPDWILSSGLEAPGGAHGVNSTLGRKDGRGSLMQA